MKKKYNETLHYEETFNADAFQHAKRAKERHLSFDEEPDYADDPNPVDKWLNAWRASCLVLDGRVAAGEQDDIRPVWHADDYEWSRGDFESDIEMVRYPVFMEMVDEEGNTVPGTKQVVAMVRNFSVGVRIAEMLNKGDCPPHSTDDEP